MKPPSAIAAISAKVAEIKAESPLAAERITILGASKGQQAAIIEEGIKAGLSVFGENRVQEAEAKWPGIRARHPDVTLHLIGPLQTNKVRDALQIFDAIQTLDREKLADALAHEMEKTGRRISCFVQVNTGKEAQKAGVIPEEADAIIAYARKLQLPVVGLMCVPPEDQPAAPHFALLRQIAQRNNLAELSMGMSNDYEEAIRMGSTCIRIGRAIFGERKLEERSDD